MAGSSPDPSTFASRLLLAVVGLSPQVVTETLHALVVQRDPPFWPSSLHLITTEEGAERIRLQLLDQETGAFGRFAREYAPALAPVLTATEIQVLSGADKSGLTDIATADDSMSAGDQILGAVRQATTNHQCAIYASLAGGRKTMGFLLGYAMSLFGRPQDRLTHVLVNAPFQDHPEFFYPPVKPRVLLATASNRPVRTDAARIVLTDIPFVRLREGMPTRLLEGQASFAQTVTEAQAALRPAAIEFDPGTATLRCRDHDLRMAPADFAFGLWLARRRKAGGRHGGALAWREAAAREFLNVYMALPMVSPGQVARVRRSLREGVNKEWFEQRISRFNKLVKDALGSAAGPYLIKPTGGRPNTRYGFALPASAIKVGGRGGRGKRR